MLLLDSTTYPKLWYIDEDLMALMREYEDTTSKLAIRDNKITGMFLKFKFDKENE